MRSKVNLALLITLVFLSAGCATLLRNADYNLIVKPAGFNKSFLKTKHFTLTSYYRFNNPGEPLNIYIEGDGNAWLRRMQLSMDPTPRHPIALELAVQDPSANVAYLARPGQYTKPGSPICNSSYWSTKRYSQEVVGSMSEAIDQLRSQAQAKQIHRLSASHPGIGQEMIR